jgi:hypothetical protein
MAWGETYRRRQLRLKILRHVVPLQRQTPGAIPITVAWLHQVDVIEGYELARAEDALLELVDRGVMVFDSGMYYLRGHEPRGPW